MLTIALQRIEFDGRHGATAVERRSTRKFEVDIEMEVDAAVAERSDLLADTVDYSRVAEAIVGGRRRASRTTCWNRSRAGCWRRSASVFRASAGCGSSCGS